MAETPILRTCMGSTRFGIEAHEAPVDDFPRQLSQKDGLGRMCATHWNQYTTALRKAALARKAADGGAATEVAPTESEPAAVAARKEATAAKPEPIRTRVPRGRRKAETAAEVAQEPTPLGRLSRAEGEQIVKAADAAREAANVEEASIA